MASAHFGRRPRVWLSLARALRSGRRARRFKSSHPDHFFLPEWGKSGIIIRKSKQLLYKSLDLSAVAFSFAFMFFAAQKNDDYSLCRGGLLLQDIRLMWGAAAWRRLTSGFALVCGSVWLERCVRDAEPGGSNPLTPTIFLPKWAKKHEAVRLRFMHRRCASWHALSAVALAKVEVPLHTAKPCFIKA